MGVYSNTIRYSGFSGLPDDKYYNNYSGTSYTGHALTETAGWYSGYASFVDADGPWFSRSANYGNGIAGIFYYTGDGGGPFPSNSSRFVIINE